MLPKPAAKTPPKKRPAATAKLLPPLKGRRKDSEGTNSRTVEEIIARVNNEIITRSELDKSAKPPEEVEEECQRQCTPEQQQSEIDEHQKSALKI